MKKNFGKKNWMFPMPVLMIGTYNEDGTPNMMNAAWGGITLEDEITICIDTGHKTWANIAARKAFTVAFGTADTVRACDYLGLVSGKDASDKVAKSGLTASKSEFVDAPVMTELPLVLECELVSMNEENCNVVGRILNCAVEELVLTDGKPDAAKMKPICYDPCAHVYRIMGDAVAKAFSCGKEIPTKNHQLTEREFNRGVCNPWAKLGCQEGRGQICYNTSKPKRRRPKGTDLKP